MIQDRILSNRYKDEMAKLLGGYEGELEKGKEEPFTMELPTDFKPVEGFTETGYHQGMQSAGSRQVQTTVPRPYSPEEKAALKEQYRRQLVGIGAGYPRQMRVDPYAAFPQDRTSRDRMSLDEYKARQQAKVFAPRKPDIFFDNKGNTFDSLTKEGKEGIAWSKRKGYNPRRPASEQDQRIVESILRQERFTGDPEVIKALEEKREQDLYTPEEIKQRKLKPVMKYFDNLTIGKTKTQKQIIEKYRRKARQARPGEYGTIIQNAYRDVQKNAPKEPLTQDIVDKFRKYYKTREATREALIKNGYDVK